jgi:hypothetical protein
MHLVCIYYYYYYYCTLSSPLSIFASLWRWPRKGRNMHKRQQYVIKKYQPDDEWIVLNLIQVHAIIILFTQCCTCPIESAMTNYKTSIDPNNTYNNIKKLSNNNNNNNNNPWRSGTLSEGSHWISLVLQASNRIIPHTVIPKPPASTSFTIHYLLVALQYVRADRPLLYPVSSSDG